MTSEFGRSVIEDSIIGSTLRDDNKTPWQQQLGCAWAGSSFHYSFLLVRTLKGRKLVFRSLVFLWETHVDFLGPVSVCLSCVCKK